MTNARTVDRRRQHKAKKMLAVGMLVVGLVLGPIGLWVTDEPPIIVILSVLALVYEGITALLVVDIDEKRDDDGEKG